MAENGETSPGVPHRHSPHGDHPRHVVLARLHTEGWFAGDEFRRGLGDGLIQAFMTGFLQGVENRGSHGD